MNPVKNIFKCYGILILLGFLQRFFLFIYCKDIFSGSGDLCICLFIGLVYDFSFISFILIAVYGFELFALKKAAHFVFYTLIYCWIILNAFDLFSINYNGIRAGLNSFQLFKPGDLLDKAFDSATTLVFIVFLICFFFPVFRFGKNIFPAVVFTNIKSKIIYPLLLFLFTLIYLPFPLNYYSDQVSIPKPYKQLALNSCYNWFTSFTNSNKEYLMNIDSALYNFKIQQGIEKSADSFLQRPVNYSDSAYNTIIVIIMESFGANRCGILNGDKELSPNFDTLCAEGKLFTRCFACGPRTQYGLTSVLYGFPHILGYNLFRQNKLKLPFSGLTALLKKNNYKTHFVHGGNARYDDMSLFLNSDAPVEIKDVNDIRNYKFKNSWGVDDEALFNFSENYINPQEGKNLYCILSMSNHEPFQLPNDFIIKNSSGLSRAEKTYLYSDYALGTFIKKLKQSDKYNKCLIIITGDHGELYSEKDAETKLYHVPLLIINPSEKGIKDNRICSHADIAEYILSKTGYKGNSHFLGMGLVRADIKNVFYRNYSDEIYNVCDSVIYQFNYKSGNLNKLFFSENLYVNKIKNISSHSQEYFQVSTRIKARYYSQRFIFENGLYTIK